MAPHRKRDADALGLRRAVLLTCLLFATVARASASSQADEDLTFEEEGVARLRREIEVAPVAAPVQQEPPSILTRVRRQWGTWFGSDDEDDDGSAVEEGSGFVRIYRVKIHVLRRFESSYSDKTSSTFSNLATSLERALESTLRDVPGDKVIKVSHIRQAPSGNLEVTIDINYEDFSDESTNMRNRIRTSLDQQYLGIIPVNSQFFSFEEPTGIYRVKIHVLRRFESSYSDKTSSTFSNLATSLERALESILRDVPGDKAIKVSHIRQAPSGNLEVTIDINYEGFSDESTNMRNRIRTSLDQQYLGTIPVNSQFFSFEEPTDPDGCRGDNPFACVGGAVICEVQRCDGIIDCPQGDDEEGCECQVGEFTCDQVRCLPTEKKCDGIQDCMDNTDEANCAQCKPNELSCDGGTLCITPAQQCDGHEDCFDRSDEQGCSEPPQVCLSNQFTCNTGECIDDFRKCDYMNDCPGGEDERQCPCRSDQYECNSGQCIDGTKRCDRNLDCDDGTDENVGCPCEAGSFTCLDGMCIDESLRCDGEPDCFDRSDEDACPACNGGAFLCGNNKCIPAENACDGSQDCDTDEMNCCEGSGMFECDSGSTCLNDAKRCDGVFDCRDGYDEDGCPCGPGQWTCRDGLCITAQARCDNYYDCPDFSDEENCPTPCGPYEWTCRDGTCISQGARCNSQRDCPDSSDEEGCSQECRPTEWTCRDRSCIPQDKRCNGGYDCPDNSDEEGCPPPVCRPDEWTCRDGSCVAENERCDGTSQCLDKTDEENCPRVCGSGEWTCADGSCVPGESRCDGRYDCPDYTDEAYCPDGCRSDEWTCQDGSCIPQESRCDGRYDCPDYTDEERCPQACSNYEWACQDGSCIPYQRQCDGRYDCPDYSDEEGCEKGCSSDEWTCRDGSCIPQDSRCDGRYDCRDYSDEEGCTPVCGPGDWQCRDGTCLPQEVHCDGIPHCLDRSDEENCARPCGPDEWTCGDRSCIPLQLRCDGGYDCPDYSDEQTCPAPCDPGQWECSDGTCISERARCDGLIHCQDSSDEKDCGACRPGEWECRDGSCISAQQRCDGQYHCRDYSDEQGCIACSAGAWRCADGFCVTEHVRCDGKYDCPDYSDEQGCPVCREDEWTCRNRQCIPQSDHCDGIPQCQDRSDEENCPPACGAGEWECADRSCIRKEQRCDNQYNCPDGSDEIECTSACMPEEFSCYDDGTCIPNYLVCDGRPYCRDGSDELNCPTPSSECRPDQFRCEDNRCIDISQRCNGYRECRGGEDETGCPCSSNEFRCLRDGFCINRRKQCDGRNDCSDGSDEADCRCPPDEWRCLSGQCIPSIYRCDGRRDCNDNSDETVDCRTTSCRNSEFQCNNGDCIPSAQRCNGYPECVDQSDESNCNYFICRNGEFIEAYRRCDGRRDCNDGSDEDERCDGLQDFLDLKTYPDEQTIQQTREVVFQCRDEGSIRAPVRWIRDGNRPLPPGTTDVRGRLTIPNVQIEHSGRYICEAQGVSPSTQGRTKTVSLQVIPYVVPTTPIVPVCKYNESTCMNGQCIPRDKVCDGVYDCDDVSDEMRCNPLGCEPNEYQCDNKRCVLKTWMCDSDDDCGDGSDERDCVTNSPDAPCRYNEFTCHTGGQCIPKSFHCDNEVDCLDGSDETGCSKPTIIEPPPRNLLVEVSQTFTITCRAIGVPNPTVIWRLNWGHVPDKCKMTSVEGRGVLTCPLAQPTDQGAYSCEAINSLGSVFAQPDCIVQVKGGNPVCQPPLFNAGAVSPQDCIRCFCFGATDQCFSADRYITQLPPPSASSFQLVGVNQDQFRGNYVIRDRQYPLSSQLKSQYTNQVQLSVDRTKLGGPSDLIIYFSLPESHKGQQLSSYGGYLRYKIQYASIGSGTDVSGPDVIIKGNNVVLMHVYDGTFQPGIPNQVDVRFITGQWFKRVVGRGRILQTQEPASREEIMMVLENMELLLIRAMYNDGLYIDATLSDIQLDTAVLTSSEQGRAMLVEECRCPPGYVGLSCQNCAPNYKRVREGPWLGRCVPDAECPHGEYGDPANNIPCLPCPCPLTTPTNQFSSTCKLDVDGQVTCDCLTGYVGRRCERCDNGYEGNPNVPGQSCQPVPPKCEWYEFICADMSLCVHKDKRCDLTPDCPDGSDELYCESVTCMTTFTCSDGSVHPWSRRCDGIKDCFDYADEKECDVCFNSGHRCGDRHCIHFERICDGQPDCYDQSDELPENCLDELPCDHVHQWTCADPTHKCIDRRSHCDGVYDCPDRSDERYCNCTCDIQFNFLCRDGTCLDSIVRCNGRYDCPDGSDEGGCGCNLNTHHACGDGTCIERRYVCDFALHCRDGSDEQQCNFCDDSMHRCGDGMCISKQSVCDGRVDCSDNSDEPWTCNYCDPNTMHQCGDGTCIDRQYVCNGRVECSDRSDEPPNCQRYCDERYEFTCRSGRCIDQRLHCNGFSDCEDGSDEVNCQSCSQYDFQCGDGSCINRQLLCNGWPDCADSSDESEQAGCCVEPYFFRCSDGTCIDSRAVCNRYRDCSDGSDEYNCPGECNPAGSYSSSADPITGRCQCKEFVSGPKCDTCIQNSFYLHDNNRFGCIDCFCMGITEQCTSSTWYRQQESVSFTNDRQGFELVDKFQQNVISNDIFVDSGLQELVFREFSRLGPEVYYWKLPQRFLGDKVTSYGGNLTYSLRYVPAPAGLSSANAAAAVEIYGNDIVLKHFSKSQLSPSRQEVVSVPLYEQHWERQDGQEANREHFLMALADLEYILIKATYTTNTREVGLKEVILDYAEPRNTGQERAYAVEMCECPQGYQGLSCEDCAIGYTRSLSGLHLGTCIPCDCNGHSEECDPEDGVCTNCRDNTAGDYCDECAPGFYREDASGRCIRVVGGDCNCDPRGSVSTQCYGNRCQCKANVRGEECDTCLPGYFHLSARNPEGCLQCWCSGASSQCFSSNYYRTQLPMQLLTDHGFTLSNRLRSNVIREGFGINVANNEISFSDFGSLRDGETYYWSLPQMFTGNRLPSYGGNLTITQRYQAQPRSNIYADPDVIIRSSGGRELIWMNSRPLQPINTQTYVVPLYEENFTMNQQPASRSEFLNALSSVEAILVRATLSDRMSSTFLRDVTMDTAVPSQTGQGRAFEVEQCQCPVEYGGLSCEQCKPGYYRDTATNKCNRCRCNGHEESCALRPDGGVRCNCLPGYYGDFCEGSGLMLELRPIKVLFDSNSREQYENFTCSYHSSEPLQIAFTLEPALVKGETPLALMDARAPYSTEEYTNGAKHFISLRILNGHKTVTCRVYDAANMEVAQMVSQIMYVSRTRRARPHGGRQPQPTVSVSVTEPSIQITYVGSTVQFRCSARSLTESQSRVPVTWSKFGGELPFGRATDNRQGLLVITQVRVSDSGEYVCTASDGFRVYTQNATLTVEDGLSQLGAPRVTLEERREVVELRRGQTLEVRCSAEGSPRPQVTWSYGPNRDRLPFNVLSEGGILTFRNAQPAATGEYYCTATNTQGSDYARIIINILPSDIRPRPTAGPLIIVQVSQPLLEVRSGETVRVSCTAGSPGVMKIEWSRLSDILPSQAVIASGELVIANARPVDSGIYVCRITDERSGEYEESSTRIIISQFVNLPSVRIEPDRQTINQGTNAELRCLASGDPTPVITWSKVNENFGVGVNVDGSILRITNAVVTDRGMYICSAQNDGGIAQAAAIVEVERREPPVIEIYPEIKQIIVIGSSALFQCHLTAGIPNPTVRWERTDGKPLTPNTETLNGGVLRFNQVKGDEEGSYTCTAENDAGSIKAVAILEIQSLPVISINPGPSPHRVRIGHRVRLECSAQGDPAPTVSWQKLQVNFPANIPSLSVTPTVAVYEITSASRADEGTYQCSARNAAGVSEERLQLIIDDDVGQPSEYIPYPPSRPGYTQTEHSESVYSVPVGGNFELKCSSSERDDVLITFRRGDDRQLPRGYRVQDGVLYLTNVDESAAGEYACVGTDRITGSILFTIYSTIQVLAPPRITLDPARQVVRPGDRARIFCSATGSQPITINWSKDDGYMPPSVIINGGEMMFRGIETTDAGRYICEAINSAGTAKAIAEVVVNATKSGEEPKLPTVHVTDLKPEEKSWPEFFDIGITEETHLELDDGVVVDSSGHFDHSYLSVLETEIKCYYLCENSTKCLNASQVCDGIVDCQDEFDEKDCPRDGLMATSIFDKNKCVDFFKCGDGTCYPFYLNCDGHCDCNDCKDEKVCFRNRRQTGKEEPLLTAIQQDVLTYVGQTAELRCEASGINPNAVTWSRVGGRLPPGAIPRGNQLRLPYVKPEDSGRYRCEATTETGIPTSDVITLTIESESY